MKQLFSLIETEANKHSFTRSSESNLLRVIDSTYDKISLLSDCLNYPHYIALLVALTSNSNYLTDILVRNPEYFYWAANILRLEKPMGEEDYSQIISSSAEVFRTFNSKVNALRRLKRKEILRIGVKDIFLQKPLEEITEELSCLGKTISGYLFELCYKQISNKYNLNLSDNRYCLVSLGKLGGKELNYSSDIDLIVFYDENELLSINKEFQEIFKEVILLFIESSSCITDEGYIYRIDFRLRPSGKNSPLSKRLSDYLLYYETKGEDWERQMLIKSDFVGGNKGLYRKFKQYLSPFIYPLSLNFSPLEQVKKLKRNIEKKLRGKENIKLAPGGIRDIEFSVQSLQLLNGGRIKSLQTGNTLKSIEELQKGKLLSVNEAKTLREAYTFYRKIEHYLQLMNDTQTHSIPSEGEMLEKLSSYFGFNNSNEFLAKVEINLTKVAKIYRSITGDNKKKSSNEKIIVNFYNRQSAEKDLEYLREGKGLLGQKEFDRHTIEAFDKIYDNLLNYLLHSINPDQALKNFVRVIRQANFPSIWYEEFRDKKLFKSFLTLCEFSQTSIDLFAEDKKLRDLFLSKKIFTISGLETSEFNEFIFRLSTGFTIGIIKAEKIASLLSEYFQKKILESSLSLNRYEFLEGHYFIAALGSLGSNEMTFASDLDLIFISDTEWDFFEVQKIFQDFLGSLRNKFASMKVDCRLRPEGKSGMLVWDINSYIDYILSRARTWELQSFTKLKFIAGNKNLFNRMVRGVKKRLDSEESTKLKPDFIMMRNKMLTPGGEIPGMINLKKTRGGITDIEFILEYLILCNPKFFQKFRSKDNTRIIGGFIAAIPELKENLGLILSTYKFFKSLILHNQNIFHQTSSIISRDQFKLSILAKRMGYVSAKDLENSLDISIKEIISEFNQIFGR